MIAKKKEKENSSLIEAFKDLCAEKKIAPEVLFDAIESVLKIAYRKNFNQFDNVEVSVDRDTGDFHVYSLKKVVEKPENNFLEISLEEARKINSNYKLEDTAKIETTPKNFGRIAAQAAKQFLVQKLQEVEKNLIYAEFSNRNNEIIKGRVIRIEGEDVILEVGKTEAILVSSEQIPGEILKVGDIVRAYILEVRKSGEKPQIYLSRSSSKFLRKLIEIEIPEIQDGIVEVITVAREAGSRSKIAVRSKDTNIEAVGSCIGQYSMRIRAIQNELGEEKLDIIEWNSNPGIFIANALSPAQIISIALSEEDKNCRVVVPNNQLSLAIGKEGQNVRLAARLTGWKIDIKNAQQADDELLPKVMHEVDISTSMMILKARQKWGAKVR